MDIIINDIPVTAPFRVYDISTGHFIFSLLNPNVPGDIPPDIATLPVVGLRVMSGVLYIDTVTGNTAP